MGPFRRAAAWLVISLSLGGCAAIAGLDSFTKDNCSGGCEGGTDGPGSDSPRSDAGDGKVADHHEEKAPDATVDGGEGGGPSMFTVGGTVTGLVGTGLALSDGTDTIPIGADGMFTFPTALAKGTKYDVTVSTQPSAPTQTCTVSSGSGTVGGADVTNVSVSCGTASFTIGGTLSGLAPGDSIVLQDNGGDNLTVLANGSFTFATPVASGSAYAVTILTQPSSPAQTCSVSAGAGTVGTGNVTSVAINCGTNTYTIGGTVSGLAGTLVLQDLGGDNLTLTSNGPFAFATPLMSGATYVVTVLDQPTVPAQTCTVSKGTGTVGSMNVTSVSVSCSTNTYTIGGTISGLSGTVVLENNAADPLTLSANGPFTFSAAVASGQTYAVTVFSQPSAPSQKCTVTNGSGSVTSADITNVTVKCVTNKFTVGGTVSGLAGSGLVLQNNLGDNLSISTNGKFTFSTKVSSGKPYSVTVLTQPTSPSQVCSVASGAGTVGGANVTNVKVTCSTDTFTVGGTLSGLPAYDSVTLQDNGLDNLKLSANGGFTFSTKIASGSTYKVTVLTQPPTPYSCFVSNGSGTVTSADITNVKVTCTINGCGRFTSGFTGSWTTVSPDPFSYTVGFSDYLPAGASATLYLVYGGSFDSYVSSTDTYGVLAAPPTAFASYGSAAFYNNALWAITGGSVIAFDTSAGTWSTPATGLTTGTDNQTTVDDAGNLWSYQSEGVLLEYSIASGTTATYTLSTALGGGEPRIAWDSCTQLLYLTDYYTTPMYSYDPVSGTQTQLSSLPAGLDGGSLVFQDGFCGDRSGHLFAVTNSSTMYQYTIATDTWTAMPAGGPTGSYNSACGVGADGYLYATDPGFSTTMYKIQLN